MTDDKAASPVVIDICVATYRRPKLLHDLLESLVRQETGGNFVFTIIVVDNDGAESARSVVEGFRDSGILIRYAVEPEVNIALARNRALALATGEYVASIDDDETAVPSWLASYFSALQRGDADLAFGPGAFFLAPDAVTRLSLKDFHQPTELPDGATKGFTPHTGNCCFRRSVLSGLEPWFRPEFGRSGGSDTEFFERAFRLGFRPVWCAGALTHEIIPRERATFSWLFKRRLRQGMNYSRVKRIGGDRKAYFHETLYRYRLIARGSFRVALALLCADLRQTLSRLLSLGFNVGFLLNAHFGLRFRSYQ